MATVEERRGSDQLAAAEQVADTAGGTVAAFDVRELSPMERLERFLHAQPTAGPAVVLLLSVLVFGIIADNFLSAFNFSLIIQQVMVVGTVAIAQTLVILTAGIDLSVGAIMVLSSVVMGRMAVEVGLPAWLALLTGLGVGAVCGAINGVLVTKAKLPPFIATLGTLNVFFAINLWYSKSETIRSQDVPSLLQWTGRSIGIGGFSLTYGAVLMLVMFAVGWYVLQWTAWGRHVYATGDDAESARLSGIRISRTLLSVYVVAGIVCAIAGWMLIGRIGSVSPQAGQTTNLDSISAVVIGGTSLFGGRGSIAGTLLGALIVGIFRNGLALAGVDVLWQNFTVGLLILLAVAVDQRIRKAA